MLSTMIARRVLHSTLSATSTPRNVLQPAFSARNGRLPFFSIGAISATRAYATTKSTPPTAPSSNKPDATAATVEEPVLPTAAPESTKDASPASASPVDPATAPTTPEATERTPPAATAPVPTESLAEQYLSLSDLPASSSDSASSSARVRGGRSKSKSQSSIEKTRKKMTRTLLLSSVVGVLVAGSWLARDWEDVTEEMKLVGRAGEEGRTFVQMLEAGGWRAAAGRAGLRAYDAIDYLNKPAWEPLIPPPLPEPHGRPYTLVIDLDDMLVHSSWDIEHGWRTAKRPGVNYFLAYLSQFYEIVLFTTQPAYTAAPILEKLDQYGAYIPWKLFRESTRYKNKSLIKDLSYLGRDLSKVVMLDTNPEHVQLQQSNSIVLTPWTGSLNDPTSRELVSLIPFLEALAIQNVKDVRTVIKHYQDGGKHIPTAYAEAEAKLKEAQRIKWEEGREAREGKKAWIKALFGSLGGGKAKQSDDQPPELYIEQVRKNAQRMYLEEQKYWKDNEAIIKKQMDDDRDRQLKEMKGSLLGFMGLKPPGAPPSSDEESVRAV